MSVFDIKAIKEQIAEIKASMIALDDLLAKEERDPTAEEQQQLDEWVVQIGNDGSDGEAKSGLIEKLDWAEKFQRAKGINLGNIVPQPDGIEPSDEDSVQISKIRIPAQCKRHGSLKAFQGPDGDKRAYLVGQHLLATLFGNEHAQQWCHDNGVPIVRQVMKEGDNAKGGFLVADEMEASIVLLRESRGVFRRESQIVAMGSDVKHQPKRSSGVTVYFPGEAGTITASDAGVDNVQLTARKMAALVRHSSEVGADAVLAFADYITQEIAYGFADKEDECGFNGDGTSTYGGITGVLNAMNAGAIKTAATGNTAFSTLDLADFEGVAGKVADYGAMNAKWYISRVGYYESMARLSNAGGGNTTETLAGGPNELLFMGYPVVFTQVLNKTTGAQTDTNIAAFGDLSMGAMLGNRSGVSIATSEHRYFDSDEIAIRGLERFDIQVHEKGDATTAGALVVLRTPSS